MLYHFTLALGLILSATSLVQAQNLLDDRFHALPLTSNGVTYTFSQAGARTNVSPWGDPASCQANDGDNYAWALFRPDQPGTVTIDLSGSNFDTVLVLYDTAGNPIGCDDDSGDGLASRLEDIAVSGGPVYLIRISGYNGAEGTVTLTITGSASWDHPHNQWQGAQTIDGIELAYFNWNFNTPPSAPQDEYPSSCTSDSEHSVWYRFTAPDTRAYEFYTSASGDELDTVISVWTTSGGPSTEIACDDDSGEGRNAKATVALNGGDFYLVRVSTWAGLSNPEGAFIFDVDPLMGTATEDTAPASTLVLEPAHPNPFTDRTTLGYTLTAPAEVRVAVYDLLGRHVATLAEGRRAAGHHEVTFDASALPAGLYVARIESGEDARTTRLTLVR